MATYNVHGGHNPAGKIACGAVGILNESTEDRNIKDKVITILRDNGHTVYDCTVDNGTSQNDVLKKIVKKCNAHTVDLDVSIHFNAGANDYSGNGVSAGSEVWIYPSGNSTSKQAAQRIVNNLADIGFRNRGVKTSSGLYILRNTRAQSLLVEVAFVDDVEDTNIYRANVDRVALAIAEGIMGTTSKVVTPTPTSPTSTVYRVRKTWADAKSQIGAFGSLENAKKACKEGYSVFDANGNVVYTTGGNPNHVPTSQPTHSTKNPGNDLIRLGQQHAINFTGVQIAVDGFTGNETKKMKARVLQHAINLDYKAGIAEDGSFGSASKKALGNHYVKKGERQYMVTALEILLYLNGVNPNGVECPGNYGNGLYSAVRNYQSSHNLVVDGFAGRNTFLSLIS